jgi:hypothetical protein
VSASRLPHQISVLERSTVLGRAVADYSRQGFRIVSRTDTTAQLSKPKEFSVLWATLWFLVFGIGVLIYVFYYMGKKDEIVYLEVGPDGAVVDYGRPQPISGPTQTLAARTQAASPVGVIHCPGCGKAVRADRRFCTACRYEFKPDELMKRGIEACKSGRKAEARDVLRWVIRQDYGNEKAWLWLSDAVETDNEREDCLQHVLSINPGNTIARKGLDLLNQRKSPIGTGTTPVRSTCANVVVALVVCVVAVLVLVGLTAIVGLVVYERFLTETPPPMPAAVLSLGEQVALQSPHAPASMVSDGKGVSIGVMEYTVSDSCPVGEGEASGWTKFIAVRLYAENPNLETVTVFPQELSLQRDGEQVAVGWQQLSEEGEHCHGDWLDVSFLRELQPGESCEGWEIFEVTQATNAEELVVVATWGDPVAFMGSWRLGP